MTGRTPLVALGLAAGAAKRSWPLERYISLAQSLCREGGQVLVIGSLREQAQGLELAQKVGAGALNAAGQTTLRQTAALLAHCNLYIGNDSGPMQLAAAVGTPVVEISCHPLQGDPEHYNSPLRFGPWRVAHRVLQPEACSPCTLWCEADEPHCILNLGVPAVLQASRSLLTQAHSASPQPSTSESRPLS